MKEEWAPIEGFPRYMISNMGRVFNQATEQEMRVSPNNYGHMRISLLAETGPRQTRSLAMLVANAFLRKPNLLCDRLLFLDGDISNCRAENLAWRPRWFAWKYTRQLKTDQPAYYRNLPVVNLSTGVRYNNVVEAGSTEGLLFEQIWRSTYTGEPVFPHGSIWDIKQRV